MGDVAVIGCGPSGLLAAHAAQLHGHKVQIFAPEVKMSHISGAQYLHSSVDGITTDEPDGHLTYEHFGTKENYAQKIYGSPVAPCSWDLYPDRMPVPAWSLQRAYAQLWRAYRHAIWDVRVDWPTLCELSDQRVAVFCTAPRRFIQPGSYQEEKVWIAQYDGENPLNIPDQTIHYNGNPGAFWYRSSNIFGHNSVEWPGDLRIQPFRAKLVVKPLDCHVHVPAPDNVKFLGRYGQWRKGVLVDHVFKTATRILGEV